MTILLMVIDEYPIGGYWWLLINIILMAISGFFFWILVVINSYYINGYWWLFY